MALNEVTKDSTKMRLGPIYYQGKATEKNPAMPMGSVLMQDQIRVEKRKLLVISVLSSLTLLKR